MRKTKQAYGAIFAAVAMTACGPLAAAVEERLKGTADDIFVPDPSSLPPGVEDDTFGPEPEGETVERVDVGRYVGTWYEIASIPQIFQRDCAGTTATYGVLDAETISVENRCFAGGLDGREVRVRGTARVVDTTSNAKLLVDFGFGPPAPYWVVDLGVAEDGAPYPWAVVSNPDRSALWLLSRTPTMDEERFDAIIQRLERRGFNPARMSITLQ